MKWKTLALVCTLAAVLGVALAFTVAGVSESPGRVGLTSGAAPVLR